MFNPIQDLGGVGLYINNCLEDAEDILLSTSNKTWEEDFRPGGLLLGYRCSIDDSEEKYQIIHSAMLKAAELFLNKTGRYLSDYRVGSNYYKIFKWDTPVPMMGRHADKWYVDDELVVPDISLVMYLTSDFEGGNLIFAGLNKSIKPQAGDIVVFDSTTLHEVSEVLSGRRITTQLFLFHN